MAARAASGVSQPSLAMVFVSPHFASSASAVIDAVYEAISPEHVIGCVGEAVLAGAKELENSPAVAVWVAELPEPAQVFAVDAWRGPDGPAFEGWTAAPGVTLLIADPFTFPADLLLRQVNEAGTGRIIGGLAGGGAHPGDTCLFLDRGVLARGAVAARLPGVDVVAGVSQGCRPIGSPMLVTKAEGNLVFELAGKSPLEVLQELHENAGPDDQVLMSHGLMFGRVIDEYKPEWHRGDFLIRGVMGADPRTGALAVADRVEVGQTVQFHVRDAASADEDLREILAGISRELDGRAPAAALLFTCNGRGARMFGMPDHDARLVSDHVGGAVAGFFCAGELGPVGSSTFLHGFTASIAVLADKP